MEFYQVINSRRTVNEGLQVAETVHAPKGYMLPCYIGLGYPAKDAAVLEQVGRPGTKRIYWVTLDKEIKSFAAETGLDYVTNDDSRHKDFNAPPVIVNYFYHEVSAVSLANQIAFIMNLFIGAVVVKDMFRIAFPMLASSLAWGLGFSMHSLIMGHLGTDATAAASIASVAQELITCVCKGISSGAGIIIGKLLGKSMFDRAKEYGKKFCHISFWVGGIHMVLLWVLSPIVTHFFVLSDNAKHYLTAMLVFSAFFVFAYSISQVKVV